MHSVHWRSLSAMADEIVASQTDKKEQEEISEYEKEENDKYGGGLMLMGNNIKQLYSTAVGLVAVNDIMSPFKHYNLWQCDTTRRITNELYLRLREIEGVEVFKALSPYKFIVAPGLAFKFRDVRARIESLLRDDVVILDQLTQQKIDRIKLELNKYAQWTLFVTPNGELDFCYLDENQSNKEEYEKWCETYKQAATLSNSLIIESEPKDDGSI